MRHLFDSPLGVYSPLGVPKNIGLGAAALAAGIAATATTASSIYNNYQSNLANDEAYERTKELQNLQFQQQKDLYNHQFQKEADYNSPSHLRELYEKAGFNPVLMAHNGDIGNAATSPSMPNVPVTSPFGPRQVFPMDFQSGVGGISQALALGSEIKKNDAEAFERIVKSLPELGKSLGWDNARQYAKDMLGMLGVSGSQYERQIESFIRSQEIKNEYDSLQLSFEQEFGRDKAAQIVSNLKADYDKIQEEIVSLGKGREVSDAEIKELLSRRLRNFAERNHLNADTATINKLRDALYYEAKGRANSAYAQGQIDSYNAQDRRSKFISDNPERALNELVGTPDDQLSASQLVLKKAIIAERRLGRVAKNLSPLSP